jgi:predicted metal-binding transcription factor (methanogenesis marker protein 9)
MNLSPEAFFSLKKILAKDLGDISGFSDEDIENLGARLIKVTATILRIKMNRPDVTEKLRFAK